MQAPILGSQIQATQGSSVTNHIGEITRPTFNVQTQSSISTSNGVKGKGMQLGATITANAILADQLAEEAAAGSTTLEGNLWGTDDLIDVNADDGDWGKF